MCVFVFVCVCVCVCVCSPVSTVPLLSPEQLSGGCGLDVTLECFLRSVTNKQTNDVK